MHMIQKKLFIDVESDISQKKSLLESATSSCVAQAKICLFSSRNKAN